MGNPSINRKKIERTIEVGVASDASVYSETTPKTLPKNQEEIRQRDEIRASRGDEYQERTKSLQNGLQQATRETSWNMWLKDLVIVENGERLSISDGKDTDFELEWVQKHYGHLIEAVAGEEVLLTL